MATNILGFTANRQTTSASQEVLITARFTGEVSYVLNGAQLPQITLSNGAVAILDEAATAAQAANDVLVFAYTVFGGDASQFIQPDNATNDLTVTGFAENDASILVSGSVADVTINSAFEAGVSALNHNIVGPNGETDVAINTVPLTDSDLVSPKLVSSAAQSGHYDVGQSVTIRLSFDEVVLVNVDGGVPTLSLTNNGQLVPGAFASYVSGSGTKSLTFKFEVVDGIDIADVELGELSLNGGVISDFSGNAAIIDVPSLPASTSVSVGEQTNTVVDTGTDVVLDDVSITSIRYNGDDSVAFKVGQSLLLRVNFATDVMLDTTLGTPKLVLNNGGFATYVSGSGSQSLVFEYVVAASDRNTQDLGVLGIADNDAVFSTAQANQGVSLTVNAQNDLRLSNDIAINAQSPYIRSIDTANVDVLAIGEQLEFVVNFSEAVELNGGEPSLTLSNGATASYVSGAPSSSLLFRYTVSQDDAITDDLTVTSFNVHSATLDSLSGNGEASASLTQLSMLSSRALIGVDTQRPEGVVTIEPATLYKGQTANVTVTFAEPVSNPYDAITVSNGTLSNMVTDETSTPNTVWKAVFTPALGIENDSVTLLLDNTQVTDFAGNAGTALSESNAVSIDTLGPVAQFSSEVTSSGHRIFTIDFGEEVLGFAYETLEKDLYIDNGVVVPGSFTEVEAGRVFSIEVAPMGPVAMGEVSITLRNGSFTDAIGNVNVMQSFVKPWDITAPQIESVTADYQDEPYTTGDVIEIAVNYSEVVNVDTSEGVPFLALSNGQKAMYTGGSESQTLVFAYTVVPGDEASMLDVLALVKDGAQIADRAGNAARTLIESSVSLAANTLVQVDGVAPTIVTMSADDGLYLVGDEVTIVVQFSESVVVDTTAGSPILALDNGAVAQYVSGSGSPYLTFSYVVEEGNFDALDLNVNALAESGATITDSSGNDANVAIRSELNTLSYRSDVVVDAARPYVNTISANVGSYTSGDVIDIVLGWSKPVAMDDTLGVPELLLNNGAIAQYNADASTPTRLVFSYAVSGDDAQVDALAVETFRTNYSTYSGVVSGVAANLSGATGPINQDGEGLAIDLTAPTVTRIQLDDVALKTGDVATVTVQTSEYVKSMDPSYFSYEHGELSAFTRVDDTTWTATFTPTKGTQGEPQTISVHERFLSDQADNFGVGTVSSNAFTIDSAYPTVTIRHDEPDAYQGITNAPVRFVINFSESVYLADASSPAGKRMISNADLDWLTVEGGTIDPTSLLTPEDGRPAGEYSVIVIPDDNSDMPIKVRVQDSAVVDRFDNPNQQSQVLVQPVDTIASGITSISADSGAYATGETVELVVQFSEATWFENLSTQPNSERVPTLFLNNGEQAYYSRGAGTDSWVFTYEFKEGDNSQNPLEVLVFLENDEVLVDQAGNRASVNIRASENGLKDAVIVDNEGPVVAGFSAIEAHYNVSGSDTGSADFYQDNAANTGDVVWIKMSLSEWVEVSSAGTVPQLTLTNGGVASYVSGSGSNTLLFRYDVQASDASIESLAVASVSANGARIVDQAGNALDTSALLSTQIGGDIDASYRVNIDTAAPVITSVVRVEDAGENTDVVNDGYYKAGTTVAFEVSFDDALVVDTTDGSPVLTLSNGQLAEYVAARSDVANGVLRFEYEVSASDINSDDLQVLGLAEQGATITDAAGNTALVELMSETHREGRVVIDTSSLSFESSHVEVLQSEMINDIVVKPELVSFKFTFSEAVDLVLRSLDQSLTPLNGTDWEDLTSDSVALSEYLALPDVQSAIAALFTINVEQVEEVQDNFVRADENGLEVVPANRDLSVQNFRYEIDSQGNPDLSSFVVDLAIPDRTYAKITVAIDDAELVDLAQNLISSNDLSASVTVDTQAIIPVIVPALGLFIGSDATASIYDDKGNLLAENIQIDPDTGRFTTVIPASPDYPAGYRGPIIAIVDGQGRLNQPDYIDEVTGLPTELEGTIRLVTNVTEPGQFEFAATPVTELAVTAMLGNGMPTSSQPLSSTLVTQFNEGIGHIFGLSNIDTTVPTVINSKILIDDDSSDARLETVTQFNVADGISAAEQYGQVLAILSAMDEANGGNTRLTIDNLAEQIQAVEITSELTVIGIKQAGADIISDAISQIESLASDSTVSTSQSLGDSAISSESMALAYVEEARGGGLTLQEATGAGIPIAEATIGDKVYVQWGYNSTTGQPNIYSVEVTEEAITDGLVRISLPDYVIEAQGDSETVPVSYAVMPKAELDNAVIANLPEPTPNATNYTAPVLLAIDTTPPVISSAGFQFGSVINQAIATQVTLFEATVTGAEDGQILTLDLANVDSLNTLSFSGVVTAGEVSIEIPAEAFLTLEEGAIEFKAHISDYAGNPAVPATGNLLKDTIAPVIESVDFSFGSTLNNVEDDEIASVTVVTSHLEDGQLVELEIENTLFAAQVNNDQAVIILPVETLQSFSEGGIDYTVNANDQSGNHAQTFTGQFTYNTSIVSVIETTSETNESQTLTGVLTPADPEVSILPQTDIMGSYGSLSIDENGHWSYELDANDQLFEGDVVSDIYTIQTTDGGTTSITIDITGTNDAPTVANAVANQTATEDSAFSFVVPADAFADVDAGDSLTYSATLSDGSALPSWLSFDAATRTFSGTPLNADVANLSVTVTATDSASESVSSDFDIAVTNTNDAPTVANALADQSATEDSAFSFTFAADAFADVDAGDSLTFSATLSDGSALPSWLSFDATTRTFSGTPLNADVANLEVTVTATDSANATVSDTFALPIVNTNDAPTVANAVANQTATEDSAFSFVVPADAFADVDAGDSLTYSATLSDGSALPSWLSFDAATRTFSGTPLNADVANLSVTVTATDSASESVSSDFDLTVSNTNDLPVGYTVAINGVVEEGSELTVVASVTSDDDGLSDPVSFTYQWQISDNGIDGWNDISGATSATYTPSNDQVTKYLRVLTSYTDNGNTVESAQSSATVAINDIPTGTIKSLLQIGSGSSRTTSNELVNTTTENNQWYPEVAKLNDGGAIVVWESRGQDNIDGLEGIYAQRYDANGIKVGDEFAINTTTLDRQQLPRVASLADGGFVITWSSKNQVQRDDGLAEIDVFAQRFNSDGDPIGSEFLVNDITLRTQREMSVTGLNDGGWVITYLDDHTNQVYVKHYSSNGVSTGTATSIYTQNGNSQSSVHPAVTALPDGGYLLTWIGTIDNNTAGLHYFAQRYDANGIAVGSRTTVNTLNTDFWIFDKADVLINPNGGWSIIWYHWHPFSTQEDLAGKAYIRTYDANGNPIAAHASSEVQISDDSYGARYGAAGAISDNGEVLFVQSAITDQNVYARRIDVEGNIITDTYQVSSISAGTSSPSIIGLENGNFMVIWQGDGNAKEVYSQLIDPNDNLGINTLVSEIQMTTNDYRVGNTIYVEEANIIDANGVGNITWTWEKSTDLGETWTVISGETTNNYTLTSSDLGHFVRGVANYIDGDGANEQLYTIDIPVLGTTVDQTVVIDSIDTDTGVLNSDYITQDNDGLTVNATLSAPLLAGQNLMYSNDGGTNWVAINDAVNGTAIQYLDSGLTSSATIQMKVVDLAGTEGSLTAQAITIDVTAPSAAPVSIEDVTGLSVSGGTVRVNLDTANTSAGDYVSLQRMDVETINASLSMSGVQVNSVQNDFLVYNDEQPLAIYTVNSSHGIKLVEANTQTDQFFVVDTDGDGVISTSDMMTTADYSAAGYRNPASGFYLDKYFGSSDLIDLINANEFLQNTDITYHNARHYDNRAYGTEDNPKAYFIQWNGSAWAEVLLPASTPAVMITQPSAFVGNYASAITIENAPSFKAGNTYIFDVSNVIFANTNFSLLENGATSSVPMVIEGSPGTDGAKLSFTVPLGQSVALTLTNTLVTLERENPLETGEVETLNLALAEITSGDLTNGYVELVLGADDLPAHNGDFDLLASIMDIAGNHSQTISNTYSIERIADSDDPDSTNLIDIVAFDINENGLIDVNETDNNGVVGTDGSGDNTIEVWLDAANVHSGGSIELWVDGVLYDTFAPTDTEITDGIIKADFGTNGIVTFDQNDPDQQVTVEVKYADAQGTEHTDTWEYQW